MKDILKKNISQSEAEKNPTLLFLSVWMSDDVTGSLRSLVIVRVAMKTHWGTDRESECDDQWPSLI